MCSIVTSSSLGCELGRPRAWYLSSEHETLGIIVVCNHFYLIVDFIMLFVQASLFGIVCIDFCIFFGDTIASLCTDFRYIINGYLLMVI